MECIGTVIRTYIDISCNCLHLFFIENDVFISESHNHINVHTVFMQPLDLRIYRCRSKTACNKYDLLFLCLLKILFKAKLWRASERSDKIFQLIAFIQRHHPFCSSANGLYDNGNRLLFSIIITDGKRNPLSHLVCLCNYKLSRQTLLCNTRCPDFHQNDVICQFMRLICIFFQVIIKRCTAPLYCIWNFPIYQHFL